MDFKYVRIQGRDIASNTQYAAGVFSMCWKLVHDGTMDPEDAALFVELDTWFSEHLPYPEPCMRRENVICFFKTENSDLMMKMMGPAMWLLERYDCPFYVVYTNSPGEIVYEDDYQVAVKVPETVVLDFASWTGDDGDKD